MVRAFISDWELGIPLIEMAAMYEYTNINSVTRAAQRLGLRRRYGGPEKVKLEGGEWVSHNGIMRWEPYIREQKAS